MLHFACLTANLTMSPSGKYGILRAQKLEEDYTMFQQRRGTDSHRPPLAKNGRTTEETIGPDTERAVGVTVQELTDILTLASVKGLGPQKFKALHVAGLRAIDVLNEPNRLPITGKRGDQLRNEIQSVLSEDKAIFRQRAKKQVLTAFRHEANILTYWHPAYPKHLYASNYPLPVLYARGSLEVLGDSKAVACVGSRNIRSPYAERHTEFAEFAVSQGFAIVSGFALGADTLGHQAAHRNGGKTVCVMPGGIDRPFPPENRGLWQSLLKYPHAVMVTEAPFGTGASALNLRRRNKLIAALALGVLVSQTTSDGGAMNAFRFAVEQHKMVGTFGGDGTKDTSGNECIGQEKKVPITVFPERIPALEEWKKWLLALSFLT